MRVRRSFHILKMKLSGVLYQLLLVEKKHVGEFWRNQKHLWKGCSLL